MNDRVKEAIALTQKRIGEKGSLDYVSAEILIAEIKRLEDENRRLEARIQKCNATVKTMCGGW